MEKVTENPSLSDKRQVVVGSQNNSWPWLPKFGWDLTHPANQDLEPSGSRLLLECEISNVVIDSTKTALMIIDMQNFSLHPALGREVVPSVEQAEATLVKVGLPAARRAKIQVVWLNWGLTEDDLENLSPAMLRVFA